jgi:hypothetical protein
VTRAGWLRRGEPGGRPDGGCEPLKPTAVAPALHLAPWMHGSTPIVDTAFSAASVRLRWTHTRL